MSPPDVLAALSNGTVGAIGVITAAAIGACGTWIVARRSTSGSVRESDAQTLWRELRATKDDLKDELVVARQEVEHLRAEVTRLRAALDLLRTEKQTEIDDVRNENTLLRQDNVQLNARIAVLESEVIQLRETVGE